ncbi:heterogeneous nuclear ribonucleoprotein 1-like isoform X2 [Limulus polyphemus]|uniref:Heterogeneous nuclear ribonucleoprotein 1-like isoform X2 n=1 Tax=Limulus polyphemus TaxID=6850 RepID=A0ABM1T8B6_LIMPO|nr:heterogeneous nuclear ribonucleoprotein 1-like isoform X2 [Limulus polyphemus]XP_022252123.1 heterogeneous nuclear ribonucleoprotein 1-like isoform X2 [Limulus polyphemus]XP_022252124.1 heterogeneous nuclear ribonucleoprotein 1-like isoform X2 [Limulus polyphemus]XP_022252126.1 heterogeneous nuclear ribonucleoprotein 1-like isoform X2 [Limulus polyphemus]XP_022252127.1 heterogeneous nuclear ribonucleoprotein 1-like isoform X2 [Limulus polyphemus]XP_022252128.1 heterogeneous nuclear ribonucl
MTVTNVPWWDSDLNLSKEARSARDQCFQDTKPETIRNAETLCRETLYSDLTELEFLESICSDNGTLTKMMWRCVYDELGKQYPGVGSKSNKQSLSSLEIDMLYLLRSYLGYGSFFRRFQPRRRYRNTPNRSAMEMVDINQTNFQALYRKYHKEPPSEKSSFSSTHRNYPFNFSNVEPKQTNFTGSLFPISENRKLTRRSYNHPSGLDYGYTTKTSVNYDGQGDGYRRYGSASSSSGDQQQSSDRYRLYGSEDSNSGDRQSSSKHENYGTGISGHSNQQTSNSYLPNRSGNSGSYNYGSYGTDSLGQGGQHSIEGYGSGSLTDGQVSSQSHGSLGSGNSGHRGQDLYDRFKSHGSSSSSFGDRYSIDNHEKYGSGDSLLEAQNNQDSSAVSGAGSFHYGANRPYGSGEKSDFQASANTYSEGSSYPASGSISGSHFGTRKQQNRLLNFPRGAFGTGSFSNSWYNSFRGRPGFNRFNNANGYLPQGSGGHGGGGNYRVDRPGVSPDVESNKFNLPEALYQCLRNIFQR